MLAAGCAFGEMISDRFGCAAYMGAAVALATLVCFVGVVKGVERVTKWMMLSLLVLIVVLAAKALTLEGAAKGLEFYLKPDWAKVAERPFKVVFGAHVPSQDRAFDGRFRRYLIPAMILIVSAFGFFS